MRLIYNPSTEEDTCAPRAASMASFRATRDLTSKKKKKNKLANTQETVAKAGLWPPTHSHTYVHPHPYENTRAQKLHSSKLALSAEDLVFKDRPAGDSRNSRGQSTLKPQLVYIEVENRRLGYQEHQTLI